MAYTPTNPEAGIQPIASVPVTGTVNHPLGTVVEAYDPTYGAGAFIYLYGVASNVVGYMVTFNALTGITTAVANTAKLTAPVAVSMTANTDTTTGSWYQIRGNAVIKKTAVAVNPSPLPIYISGTAGRVMPTLATSKQIIGAITVNAATVASTVSTITAYIMYPTCQAFGTV